MGFLSALSEHTVLHLSFVNSSVLPLSLALRLVNGIHCLLRDKFLFCLIVGSKATTGNIKNGGLEGITLFRIPQNIQTPTSPLNLFGNSSAALEPANLQPWLGWYHSPGFELQLQFLQQGCGQC